jgi:hypothetical protein
MFYRFYGLFKPIAEKWPLNKINAVLLLATVLIVLMAFRVIWIFIYRFIDLKPDIGIKEMIAGLIGMIYGVMWMGVILKSLQYFGYQPVMDIIQGTFSERYIMPLPIIIYKVVVTMGGKIFSGGKIYET